MATTHYTFYTVETDPFRPFLIKVVPHQGSSSAMKVLLGGKRVQAMSLNKGTAEAIAGGMRKAMGVGA